MRPITPASCAFDAGDKGATARTAAQILARNFNIGNLCMAISFLEGVSIGFTY
jgi:hypothetical protein